MIRLLSIIAIYILISGVLVSPINFSDAQIRAIPIEPKLSIKIIHQIKFDKSSYLTSETALITITDSTLNTSAKIVDSVDVKIFSKTNPKEKTFSAKETDLSSGVFVVKVKISDLTSANDTITAYYNYLVDKQLQKATTTATVSLPVVAIKPIEPIVPKVVVPIVPPPTISLDKTSYLTTDVMKVTITHQGENTNPDEIEKINFIIFSQNNPKGQTFSSIESNPNSGIFTSTVKIGTITDISEKIRITLTGDYSNIEIFATISQPRVSVPIQQEKIETSVQKVEEVKIQTALSDLKERKLEEISDKTISQIQSDIIQKENLLIIQQDILNSKLSKGENPLLLIKEREQYIRAKIDYLSERGNYIKKAGTSSAEVEEFEKELKQLVVERKNLSYDGLTKKFEKKITTTRIEKLEQDVKPTKAIPKKLDTKIQRLSTAIDPVEYAQKTGLEIKNDKVKLLVDLSSIPQSTRNTIAALGGEIESESQKQVQLNIPISMLQELSEIPTLKQIRPPTPILQHSVISEGVAFINADIVQDGGFTGQDVDVAVLDLAFNTANDEISSNIVETKSFRSSFGESYPMKGYGGEHIHGTAVAEIIVDVAPDVGLHLYAMGTELEFADAIDWAISQNIDIIAMSAGWINYPTDGTSSMTKKLEEAVSNGITVVISAGNYAETHFEGKYTDNDSNGWHEFSGNDEGLSIEVTEDRFNPIILYLLWDSHHDFDLVLIGPDEEIVDSSENLQQDANDTSLETINFLPDDPGSYEIGISYAGEGKPNVNLELFSPTDVLEYSVASGSVGVPTDAQGIITVGAIHHMDASLESFSSQGPTNHGRSVPSLMGPDAVSTVEYGEYPFYGTSAAAPYVTGVASLVLEQNPSLSPSQVLNEIRNNADKNAVLLESNYDNVYGYGKVDAEFIILNAGEEIGEDTSEIIELGEQEETSPTTVGEEDYEETESESESPAQQQAISDLKIPGWIKEQVKWWISGSISDAEFIAAIQFLIKNNIIVIPDLPESGTGPGQAIPDWIINNAQWWVNGEITDADFAKGLEYLIKVGIIII